jgi:hypothetical protein
LHSGLPNMDASKRMPYFYAIFIKFFLIFNN